MDTDSDESVGSFSFLPLWGNTLFRNTGFNATRTMRLSMITVSFRVHTRNTSFLIRTPFRLRSIFLGTH